jgi:membrane protein DedA with SNARE-associated domain
MIPLAGHQLMLLLVTYGYWAVLVIVGLESLGIPMPGETTLVAAAIYAGATHHLSIELVVLAAIAGAIAGDNVGYTIGYWGGYRLLVRFGPYVRLNEAKVKLARYIFLRHGGKVVFFGRFVSVLRTYAAFLAGTTRMPWWRFFAFNASGGTLWALIYGIGAYLLGTQLDRVSRPVEVVAAIAAVVVIVAFFVFLRRNEKRLEAEAERALPGPLDESRRPAAGNAL